MLKKVVVIDIGSNSTKIVCYNIDDDKQPMNVREEKWGNRIVRDILLNNKILSENIIKDTIYWIKNQLDLVNEWAKRESMDVTYFCFATEAIRIAKNHDYFIELLRKECGIECNVLSSREEINAGCSAVSKNLNLTSGLVVDIGGGSVEIGYFDKNNCNFLLDFVSIPIGCVTLTEQFALDKKCSDEQISDTYNKVMIKFQDIILDFKSKVNLDSYSFIGIGGTIKHVTRFVYGKSCFRNYKEFTMKKEDVEQTMHTILNRGVLERKYILGIKSRRSDILGGGTLILLFIMNALNRNEITITDVGVREGIAISKAIS